MCKIIRFFSFMPYILFKWHPWKQQAFGIFIHEYTIVGGLYDVKRYAECGLIIKHTYIWTCISWSVCISVGLSRVHERNLKDMLISGKLQRLSSWCACTWNAFKFKSSCVIEVDFICWGIKNHNFKEILARLKLEIH